MFSIIIPYYKKIKYIERCIDSIIAQTFQDFEIILVDDGSKDDLYGIIEEKYKDQLILITQENQGVSSARNKGIASARHKYIAFLDADDYWSPFYLEKMAEIINKDKNVKIIGCNYTRSKNSVENKDTVSSYRIIESYFKNQAIRNSLFTSSSTIVVADFFTNHSGFNSNLVSGEDIDVWFRVMLSDGNAYYVDNILVYYSDEDVDQATKVPKNFNKRFIANIDSLYFKYGKKIYPQEFYDFLSKYIYSSLYVIYFQKDTHTKAKEMINNIPKRYFFAELYYKMPYTIGSVLLQKHKVRKMTRKYFKFIFK